MKKDPPKRPVVIRQAWMMVLEDSSRHDMGHSFHLTEEDRVAYVSEVLASHDASFQPETIGEPEWVTVTESQRALIAATPHGLRVQ